jgi:hypothetical protein
VTRPAGLFERFKEFQFGRLFKDYDALAEETQRHQFISLKHEIEEIRRHGSIQGYVITEFTDINWEANGLMDMWRNPKVYAAELAKIQQPDVIMARLPKVNYTSGERANVETLISHYSDKELDGARVQWSTQSGASGRFNLNQSIQRASVVPLQTISFNAPQTTGPRRERLSLEVRGRDGALVAENTYEIYVFPKPAPSTSTPLIIHDPTNGSNQLRQALTSVGYKISTGDDQKALLISTTFDKRVEQHLHGGGRVVLLMNSKEALPASASLKVTPRAGSDLDGNWVTNFNWVRIDAVPFSEVAFTKILGFESDQVVPRYVIQGVGGKDYEDVLSGIFYGWLNNNGALAVQMRSGDGRIFATTFRFDKYGDDPYTTHLLDAIIRYTNGPGFAPKLRMQ